jgi:hypothetical protein
MVNANFLVALEELLQNAKDNKILSGEDGRYWTVVVTDLEKVLAWYKTYLFKGDTE